ncbi:MAG: nucleoside triphosphate pyrophosphohydrolase [Clostridia bacterium]|nr:nucleoside triphosphate pyrophosphohydrolase [Clostridia bacterium]
MKSITVVSLGPGSREYLTLGALETMEKAEKLVLRTARCDAAEYLAEKGIPFETLDALYEDCEDFDELTGMIPEKLMAMAAEENLCYAVFDAAADETVRELCEHVQCRVIPGVSLASPFLSAAPQEKVEIQTASSLQVTGTQNPLLILECDSKMLMGECKLQLLKWYDAEQPVLYFPPCEKGERTFETITLEEMDRQKKYDHTVAFLLPSVGLTFRKKFDFYDLVRVMEILRGENGCPWDKEQTHQSLRADLIEEAYETAAAIDDEDWLHVADELGDVLLQVVFHAHIGDQTGTMELGEITTNICRKMIERHRHIFGTDVCEDAEAVVANWEKIKKEQRGFTTQSQVLNDVSRGLPPLMRAEKVQKKARQVGFDWDDPRDALKKVEEEAREVRQALEEGNRDHLEEEVGDLFFSCVNAARLSGVGSEMALMRATEKFVRRFERMENAVLRDGKALKDLTISEMDVYWDSIKHDSE